MSLEERTCHCNGPVALSRVWGHGIKHASDRSGHIFVFLILVVDAFRPLSFLLAPPRLFFFRGREGEGGEAKRPMPNGVNTRARPRPLS